MRISESTILKIISAVFDSEPEQDSIIVDYDRLAPVFDRLSDFEIALLNARFRDGLSLAKIGSSVGGKTKSSVTRDITRQHLLKVIRKLRKQARAFRTSIVAWWRLGDIYDYHTNQHVKI